LDGEGDGGLCGVCVGTVAEGADVGGVHDVFWIWIWFVSACADG
jgi:hypothetical protein